MKDQEIQRLLKQTRNDQEQGGLVTAHVNDAGLPTPSPGDDEAPFVKELPFVTEVEEYWDTVDLDTAAYTLGPVIDVQNWRLLIVYVSFDPNVAASSLSLIPRASGALDETCVPIGVINPTTTAVTLASEDGFGSRTMYKTELRTPAVDDNFDVTLAFDVTTYSAFQFAAAQITAGGTPGTITLSYSLSM